MPYGVLSKGTFSYVLCGLPDDLSLKDPSTMGEATLDRIIGLSNSLTFVKEGGNIEERLNAGNDEQGNDGERNDEERRNNGGEENEGNSTNENEEQMVCNSEEGDGTDGQIENDQGETSTGIRHREKKQTTKKRKHDEKKKNDSEKKKKTVYEKCRAFLCQEPGVKPQSGTLDWILCDVCQVWYHWDCVGVTQKPKRRFNCGCNKTYFSEG